MGNEPHDRVKHTLTYCIQLYFFAIFFSFARDKLNPNYTSNITKLLHNSVSDLDSASTASGPVGSGVAQWRGEGSHKYSSRRSGDGVVSEYDQYNAQGDAVRPRRN